MSKKASTLILMRHGQSAWNKRNLFTGWVDIPLSPEGIEESIAGGKEIADIPIDIIFTSSLIRGQMTAMLAMLYHHSGKIPCIQHPQEKNLEEWSQIHSTKAQESCIPVYCAWELNERMYGKLQGLNKQETKQQFGEEQVQRWRRSFEEAPPSGESLKDTAERAIPYFKKRIVPYLQEGKNVFIAAHGNSLRAIMMFLDELSNEQVVHLELGTGKPIAYQLCDGKWSRK